MASTRHQPMPPELAELEDRIDFQKFKVTRGTDPRTGARTITVAVRGDKPYPKPARCECGSRRFKAQRDGERWYRRSNSGCPKIPGAWDCSNCGKSHYTGDHPVARLRRAKAAAAADGGAA